MDTVKRNTRAKEAIRNIIYGSTITALSHAEIQSKLNNICDRVTIYRVLERLLEEGLVHRIVNTDGVIKYASCHVCIGKHNHHHVHFSCKKCKSVTCLETIFPAFSLPSGYKVDDMNFIVEGECPRCRNL